MKFSREEIEKKIFSGVFGGPAVILFLLGSYLDALQPVSTSPTNKFTVVEIEKGKNIWQVAKKLKEKGVLKREGSLKTGYWKLIEGYIEKSS